MQNLRPTRTHASQYLALVWALGLSVALHLVILGTPQKQLPDLPAAGSQIRINLQQPAPAQSRPAPPAVTSQPLPPLRQKMLPVRTEAAAVRTEATAQTPHPAKLPSPSPVLSEPARVTAPTEAAPIKHRPDNPAPKLSTDLAESTGPADAARETPEQAAAEGRIMDSPGLGQAEHTPPSYLDNPAPDYPTLARQRGWTGEVLVRVKVDASGRVEGVILEQTSGYKILDQAAMRQIRNWRFIPASNGKVAVPGEVTVPVRFKLGSS